MNPDNDDDNQDDSSAAAAVAVVAEAADRAEASTTANGNAAASVAKAAPFSNIITIQDLPPLSKIVPALQDVGVPKMSPETGIRTTKYDDLGRMLNLIAKKIMEKKLSYIGKNQTRCKYGLLARWKRASCNPRPKLTHLSSRLCLRRINSVTCTLSTRTISKRLDCSTLSSLSRGQTGQW
jgi:hypothetical protein